MGYEFKGRIPEIRVETKYINFNSVIFNFLYSKIPINQKKLRKMFNRLKSRLPVFL